MIIVLTLAGMANTMLAIMAAYVLSLITNRILLVDVGHSIELRDLYHEPFAGSSWAVQKHMLLKKEFLITTRLVPLASDVLSTDTKVIKVARLYASKANSLRPISWSGATYYRLSLSHLSRSLFLIYLNSLSRLGCADQSYSMHSLTCGENLVEKWKYIQILHVFRGTNYFIPLLFSNAMYA